MKKTIITFCFGIILSFNLLAANRFVKKSFFSAALNEEKTYFISYPDGYDQSDTTKKFPVMIFLHGSGVNAQDIVDKLELALILYKTTFQKIFKVIFIIADGSVPPYLGSFYSNSELYGNYETYTATDLYNEIHQKYNTYNHREKWSIIGHSMGGYGSMKIALKYPDHFIGVAALSGPLHITYYNQILPLVLAEHGNTAPYNFNYEGNVTKLIYSMAGAFSANLSANLQVDFPISSDGTINQEVIPRWEANNPINYIREWKGNPKMAIFLYCGELDEYKLQYQNQIFSDSLTANHIPHTFHLDPQGDHVVSLLTSFPLGLNFLYNVMDTAQITTAPNIVKDIAIPHSYIFPNPAKDRLNFYSSDTNDIEKVTIISITGSSLKKYSAQEFKNGLDISILKPGSYLLSVSFINGQKKNYNFIKAY